jgi:hypothetical protein
MLPPRNPPQEQTALLAEDRVDGVAKARLR